MTHVRQSVQIDTERVSETRPVETELHEQVNEIHLVAGQRMTQLRTREVALRPGAVIQPVVAASIVVVVHAVDVVFVEEQIRPFPARTRRQRPHSDRDFFANPTVVVGKRHRPMWRCSRRP